MVNKVTFVGFRVPISPWTRPCAIHEIICHLFIYAAPGVSRNFTSAKGVETRSHLTTPQK